MPPADDLQLIELALDAWFTRDAGGRIAYDNEPGGLRAARFVFARTAVGNIWRLRDDMSPTLAQRLSALAAAEPVRPDLRAAPDSLEAMCALLAVAATPVETDAGPAYRFPDALGATNGTTPLSYSNRELMREMVSDFDTFSREFEGRQPRRAIVVDGAAVSVCFSARLSDRVAEAGVETREDFRGRGYAAAVVAAWARDVRRGGRVPLYSTSWENLASQAVARKLGLIMYGSTWSLA